MLWLAFYNKPLVAASFLLLTAPDGAPIKVNPDEIVSMRAPRGSDKRTLGTNIGCILFTTDGRFTAVVEQCDSIRNGN